MLSAVTADVQEAILGEDPTEGALRTVGLSVLLLVGTILCVLVAPGFALPVLAAFVAASAYGWTTHQAEMARLLTLVATVLTVLTVTFITVYLFLSAAPAFAAHGLDLLTIPIVNGEPQWFLWLDFLLPAADSIWNPRAGVYSLVPLIWATIIVTTIAGLIAGPLGVMGALFISEVASDRLREIIKPGIEILAGIPSIVFGFIGFIVLNGFIQKSFLDDGASYLIAGLVVGVMALPTVVSVAEDALASVPNSMSDGAAAMGATRWQTMKSISVPAASSGISAAIILGLGRAIGETMAVAAILGAVVQPTVPLFDMFDASSTLTSAIAHNYGSASASTVDVLFVAGVLLFVIVAGMSVVSQYIERRISEQMQGQQ
ncbi:phosphate ABC transporter permease subunit PstC [Halorientalis pallida]|uniref:Phosphate transport system permease protein n=1 Tax=Halorientalis pallida TaxID=2479928 RepID=A0A498L912_9EURY|nr:phosphate ABC transporter permease subunit PstC [Halorientalis pallida]RXK51633.1 phosphate ABC transporter permease subunit PstC [Halorientalis pallida]